DLLAATLRSDEFLAGDTTTDFIQRVQPTRNWTQSDLQTAATAAALWRQGLNRESDDTWSHAPSGWRNARLPAQATSFRERSRDDDIEVAYRVNRDGSFAFTNGSTAVIHRWSPTDIDVDIDGHRMSSFVTQFGDQIYVQLPAGTMSLEVLPRFSVPGSETPSGGLIAPMPGRVLSLQVAEGDEVSEGQMLVVLEAMKMEHHISAPIAGTVSSVLITEGQQLENGELLLTIEPLEASDG
ncbi:MAG: acetyl-CoA carboxylase biotin carboxyl carrier protein subunit, partial [Acidimicrobiales bacterium]